MFHLIMASHPEEAEAGPSGLATEEILALLGLETSDSEKEEEDHPFTSDKDHEEMGDSDEDDLCQEVLDRFERQRAFQTQLLEQIGGGALDDAEGTFDFDTTNVVDRGSSRMGVRERHFTTRLRQRGNFVEDHNIVSALQDGIRRVVNQVLATTPNLHDQDRLYFTLSSNRLTSQFQGWGLRAGEWRGGGARLDALFDRLAQALNSNEQFEMDNSFQLSITQVHHAPQGCGKPRRTKPAHPTLEVLTARKRSVIRVQNDDELCCARALVVAKARVDQHPKEKAIRQGRPLQRELALRLHDEARVPPGPCSYDALTAFSAAPSFAGYQIILVDAHRSFHITAFGDTRDKQLILLHEKGHYDVITRLPGFFRSSYVCSHCWKPYNTEGKHRCPKRKDLFGACRQKDCPDFLAAYPRGLKATRRCQTYHRDFFGETCFQTHLVKDHAGKPATSPKTTVCFRRRRCRDCFKQEVGPQALERHQCGYLDCPSCHEYVDGKTHRCFIQRAPTPQEQKKKRKRQRQGGPRAKRGVAAGLHTLQANDMEEEDVDDDMPPLHVFLKLKPCNPYEQHIANLVVAETEDDDRPVRFPGEHCLRDFLEWLDTLTLNDTRHVHVLAHNFQGYDGYFVVHQYHRDNRIVQQLRNGCKLLEVQHDRIRFIDSLSFFQMPLSAFPKTFGLTELHKGYFPHKFNLPEYQTYVGIAPALDYDMPETMSPKAKQALEKWHQEQRTQNVVFDFQKELVSYCESGVRLLKEGCLTFKRLFETLAGFNPFEHITIASACNRDLRMNRMIPDSIVSEPTQGWRNCIDHSNVALEWLTWCDHRQPQDIQHAGNAGEYCIPGTKFLVDGFDFTTNTVYEFQGCFFHGCPRCYPNRHKKHVRHCDRSVQDVYETTQQKINLLQSRGYHVVEVWGCERKRLKEISSEIQTFLDNLAFVDPLNPGDAFCGGRTNAVKLYHHVTPGQKIHYIDVTSLYPWVNKTCVYPKGHPRFISQPRHTDIHLYFGLIQCRVLPPRELYHPVLPYRHEGKLMHLSPLCNVCERRNAQTPLGKNCQMQPHQRATRPDRHVV